MLSLLSLFAVGLLVFAHELGHLLAARALGIRASQVTFGVGPALYTVQRKGFRFIVRAVPLGGSVELQGENPHRLARAGGTGGYAAQAPWKRLLVLLGGPLMSFLLSPLALVALYLLGTHVAVPLTVGMVAPGSEAAYAQLRPGDRIAEVDGLPIESWAQLTRRIAQGAGRDVTLTLVRAEGSARAHVTPRVDGSGLVRIGITQQYVYRVFKPGPAILLAFAHTAWLAGEELRVLGGLIRGGRDVGLSDAGRVVRSASEAAATGGLDSALRALAGLSVAIGLFHLVPIPALDGGRTLLVLWELGTKRRLDPRLLTVLQTVGLLLLLGLLAWVALANVRHLASLAR